MIYLGSDHAGFELKQELVLALAAAGEKIVDLGPIELDPDDDYPDFAFRVGEAVTESPDAKGILVCGTAQGVCMAANKVKGVRAVAVADVEGAVKAREHNDANVLCLSGWKQSVEQVEPIIDAFLTTRFSDEERHRRRLDKITGYENGLVR
jgi:ribose 5-phosphate isomerase B